MRTSISGRGRSLAQAHARQLRVAKEREAEQNAAEQRRFSNEGRPLTLQERLRLQHGPELPPAA